MRRVPVDPSLEEALQQSFAGELSDAHIMEPSIAELIRERAITLEDRVVRGPEGQPEITLAIFRPTERAENAPCIYHAHGGGLVSGSRYSCTASSGVLDWVERFKIVVVSVEYRLAPDHQYPAAVEDCYAGFQWTADNATELGIDPGRILVMGSSAGGGLAAAVSLLARDRGGAGITGQLLACPMLDDRGDTVSFEQYVSNWFASGEDMRTFWAAYLGKPDGVAEVPSSASPARETNFSGLPPAFIDVGSAEVFRDESIEYASRIWAAGGQAELHVWSGGFHGYDQFVPDVEVSKATKAARESWIRRILEID